MEAINSVRVESTQHQPQLGESPGESLTVTPLTQAVTDDRVVRHMLT